MARGSFTLVAVLGAAMLLAGCSTVSPAAHSTTAKPTVSAAVTVPTPTPTPTASATSAPTGPACTRDTVRISYQATDNSAGHFHGVLTFTNTGAACVMTGYPVVYLGSSEVEGPMGAASTDDSSATPVAVSVATGGTAHAAITITDAGVISGCDLVTTTHLIASPPIDHTFDWQEDGEHVDLPGTQGCADDGISLVQVGPVTP